MIIGFTAGAFDLLHAGHAVYLKECKQHCEYLIVGLQSDPTIDRINKNRPIQSLFERHLQLINSKWVDEVIPYDTENDLKNLLATIKIDARFVGEDYLGSPITGDTICNQLNIKIVYIKRRHTFSTSELRKRIENIKLEK